jgi:hypothetical protein
VRVVVVVVHTAAVTVAVSMALALVVVMDVALAVAAAVRAGRGGDEHGSTHAEKPRSGGRLMGGQQRPQWRCIREAEEPRGRHRRRGAGGDRGGGR